MAESPILKAFATLRCLAETGAPMGVQQISKQTALNVSTVHRLLQLLVRDGMVTYDPQARMYGIGTECVRLATRVLGSGSYFGRVRPLLAELAERLGETCAFTLYEPKQATKLITLVEHGSHALGYDFEIGSRDGIHAGASGKPILAFLPDAEIERILRKPLPRLTKFTVVDPDKLRRQIRQIRKCGYATSRGERMQSDSFGVGAPVFGPHKNVIGSIVVTVPYFRWRKEQLRDVAKIVMHTARQVSALSDVEHPSAGATL